MRFGWIWLLLLWTPFYFIAGLQLASLSANDPVQEMLCEECSIEDALQRIHFKRGHAVWAAHPKASWPWVQLSLDMC